MVDERIKALGGRQRDTGIPEIESVFDHAIYSGSVYMFAACRGVGKTTLLLGLAKKLAAHHKVLFVTTEQSIEQIGPFLGPVNDNFYFAESLNDFTEDFLSTYEYVCYDYLGAETNELDDWNGLVQTCNRLAEYAKQTNSVIFTAAQADDKLTEEYNNNRKSELLQTGIFVSFAKHMSNKIAGGAYLLKDGTLINFKNRYGVTGSHSIIELDYSTKTLQAPIRYY